MHARRLHAAGLLTDDELREVEAALARSRRRASSPSDEDVHSAIERLLGERRPQDPRRPLAQRPGRGRVPALRRRRVRARRRGDRAASPARSSTAPRPRPRRRCPATRTCSARSRSRSATTCSRGSRCSSATARASRFAARQATPSPLGAGALAGSTLAAAAAAGEPMRNSLDAVADRDFALDYLYACAVLVRAPLADRRGARALGDERVRLRAPARGRRRPARR